MKNKFILLILIGIYYMPVNQAFSQSYTLKDTLLAQEYETKADSFYMIKSVDSTKLYLLKSISLLNKLLLKYNNKALYGKYIMELNYYYTFILNKKNLDSLTKMNDSTANVIRNTFGEKSYEYGMLLYSRGCILLKEKNFEKADSVLCKSLTVLFPILGNKKTIIGHLYFQLSTTNYNLLRYDLSINYSEKALQIYSGILGPNHNRVASIYYNIALTKFQQGNYKAAKQNYQKAFNILINFSDSSKKNTAKYYFYYGNCCLMLGELTEAKQCYNKSLEIYLELYGENNLFVANAYNNTAVLYKELFENDISIHYSQKAEKVYTKLYGENYIELSNVYLNFANVYNNQNMYSKSLQYFQKALTILIMKYGENHPNVANVYIGMGLNYQYQKDYSSALLYYQKAQKIYKSFFGENNYNLSKVYNNIGLLYYNYGKYSDALSYYQKAIPNSSENNSLSLLNFNIGNAYQNLGEYSKSLQFYKKALDIDIPIYGKAHPLIGEIYLYISKNYLVQNNYTKAIEYCNKSMSSNYYPSNDSLSFFAFPNIKKCIKPTLLLASALQKSTILYLISGLKDSTYQTNKYLIATFNLLQYCDTLMQNIKNTMTFKEDKLKMSIDYSSNYNFASNVAIEVYKRNQDPIYLYQSFYFASKAKASQFMQDIAERVGIQYAGIPDSIFQMDNSLKYRITGLKQRIENTNDSIIKTNLSNELFKVNREQEALTAMLENNYPKYYNYKYSNKIAGIKEIQILLPDNNTALIEYCLSDSILTAFVIRNDTMLYYQHSFDSTLIKKIRQFSASIKNFDIQEYVKLAGDLYQVIMKPIEPLIGERNKLIIIPSSYLTNLPFEALLTEKVPSGVIDETKLPYAIKKYEINYHLSSTLWAETQKKEHLIENKSLLAFAPVFGHGDTSGYIVNNSWNTGDSIPDEYACRSTVSGKLQFNELKYSKEEVKGIMLKSRNKNSVAYFGREASEKQFREQAPNYDIIHIASHSFINNDYPDMSGIAFSQAGADSTDTNNDGILFSGEAYNLTLKADLLVLSSCESGLGRFYKGEGVMSLTRGFLYAGCRNILYSLWKVYDKQTSQMMINFYNQVSKNKSYSKSLQEAKLEMIKNKQTANPKYWAGFVLIGE